MARRARNDVTSVQKIKIKPLSFWQAVLVFVGKPFYYILVGLIILLSFLLQGSGKIVRLLSSLVFRLIGSLVQFILHLKISLPKPTFPKHKIIFQARPKISFTLPRLPRIRFNLRIILMLLFIVCSCLYIYLAIFKGLPSPKKLITRNQEVSTKIYDRNGILLYKIYKDKNRTVVPLSTVPNQVRLATLAAEDAEFYSHPGFSLRGIIRAITKNLKSGNLSGGSTITQQLVKNALLSPEKTLVRKIRELILSVGVEMTFSKDQILEMYLNEVSYGGTAYGIQEASRVYFGKEVGSLSLAEAALLAGLPKSPTRYSPFGANPDLSIVRQREVLNLMRINKFISADEESEALHQTITFAPNKTEIKAPHFVMYVKEQLVEKYGEEVVETGGLEVITTLDYSVQQIAEKAVKDEVNKLGRLNVRNGAALVLKPDTGEILAMVGSKDYFDTNNDGNVNVTLRNRQPGSSIKVVNYAYALSHGYTPASIIDDSPVIFSVSGQPPYSPKNYDGTYRGRIPLRNALAESRNIPAVKVLASYGVGKMIALGQKMGITTWNDPSRFGLSLTLGGGEVKLIDLATVYATIANYGRRPEINSVVEVKNYKGKVLESNTCLLTEENQEEGEVAAAEAKSTNCLSEEIISPQVSFLLIDILKDNLARSRAFGINSALVIPNHPEVAVKTGTSNDLKDNLTVGFTQNFLVATWVGNNNGSPMSHVASGVTGASPIWNKIMTTLTKDAPKYSWPIPEGLQRIKICGSTDTLSCEGCGGNEEWFISGTAPQKACDPAIFNTPTENNGIKPGGQILDTGARTQSIP